MKKRVISLMFALLLCMSLCIPVLAVEGRSDYQVTGTAPSVQPMAVTVLKSLNVDFVDGYSVKVKPDKGTNLKFVGFAADHDVTLKVYKDGGWWASKTVTIKKEATAQSYDLITNCNGGEYELVFTSSAVTGLIGKVCQTNVI